MLDLVAAPVLAPILVAQGLRVRRRTPRLPEPPGDREGVAGAGPPLRLLIAGDSAAAGVGAGSQAEALSGRLVERLRGDYRVAWRLEASTGETTRDVLARLQALPEARFDVLVTSLGVNDVTGGRTVRGWLADQRELRALARARLGVSLLVIAGLPPMGRFPALPQPLRWVLGRRATRFDDRLRGDLEDDPSARFLGLRFALDRDAMAPDGFHPGPAVYREWADRAAAIIREELGTSRDDHTNVP